MKRPFEGVRVIDFTTTIAGPYCTRLLADLGADVVKIESPDGDMMRTRPPVRDGASSAFGQLNAGKRSVVLDLKRPAARRAVARLAARSDVLVENFRPGVMERFGLDWKTVSALNPRLVYCAISGYGQSGPASQRPAYAPVIHAASGYDLAHLAYQPGRMLPDYCGIFTADVVSGIYAFGAIGAALHQRAHDGRGQFVDVSMLESMLTLTLNEVQAAQFEVPPLRQPLFGPVHTRDGFVMLTIASERSFRNLAEAIGHPEAADDPRFAKYATRREHWPELMELVEAWSRTVSSDECLAALDRHGVPASPYRTVAQALADPQMEHRGALATVRDAAGTFRAVNPPFRMSEAGTSVAGWSSSLGEHTREVLREAGFDDAEIDEICGQTAQE